MDEAGSLRRKPRRFPAVFWTLILLLSALATAFALAPNEVAGAVTRALGHAAAIVQYIAGSSASGLLLLGSVVGGGPSTGIPPDALDPTSTGAGAPSVGGPTPDDAPDDDRGSSPVPSGGNSEGGNATQEPSTDDASSPPSSPAGSNEPLGPSTSSSSSSTTSPTPLVAPPPPVLVSGLVARPGSNPGEIDLAWSPAAATTYAVYRGVTASSLALLDTTSTSTFTDTGLSPGATYYYAVAALTGGVPGPLSATTSSVAQTSGEQTLPTPELPTLVLGAAGFAVLGLALRRRAP
ncbi:MAG TPA: hypothetical protein VM889_02020 [Candidatus Thermoplasmatota archaeon]|nr:hypothetical protein [Candidatus Thermoplasmatota archaeon]